MKNAIYIVMALLLATIIPSCIDEYTPKTGKELSDILVVEGAISGGENTLVKLSRSVGLSAEQVHNPVSGAIVYVERSDGWMSEPGIEDVPGEYRIMVGELDLDASYSLVIKTDGEEYRSEPSKPMITPPIDSVSWKKKGNGEPVTIHVTTHDNDKPTGYYRWAYKEDWEVMAHYFASGDYDLVRDTFIEYKLNGLNTYYCWNNDSSRVLLLDDTEKLSGNLIYEKKLLSIDAFDDKISYLYSILVKQWSVSKSGYQYLANLQNNIDQAGSIFAPQPSELRGNIDCVTSPEEVVIGYVDVATAEEKRIYIQESEVSDPGRGGMYCSIVNAIGKAAIRDSMQRLGLVVLDARSDLSDATLTERRCVDCRMKGSKKKPSFWPNNHQ